MRKMKYLIFLSIVFLVFSACSNSEEEAVDSATGQKEDLPEEVIDEEEEEKEEEINDGELDFMSLLEEVENITDGETEVIYENTELQIHEEDEYSVSLDGYIVAELNDFHANFSIPFDSEEEGFVLLTHFTIENTQDEDIAYTPLFDLRYSGADRYPGPNRDIIPEDSQIVSKLNSDNSYVIGAGDAVSGYYAIPLRTSDIKNIEKVDFAEIEIPEAGDEYEPDNYSYKSKIGEKAKFTIYISGDGDSKKESDQAFYQDRTNQDNMGSKTMIKEKSDINDTKSLGKSNVTLEGYQFTEFEPNEHEAGRFDSFDTGIVLLNVKLLIENGEDADIALSGQSAKLTMNNGKQYTLHELMLSPYKGNEVIEKNSEGESILVFALDKEQYEKIWQDKSFELEYGPLKSDDLEDLSKGKKIEFELPQ